MAVLPTGIGAAAGGGGYNIERSLRFNSADSAYLNRTPASAGSRTTWTFSCWAKKCKNGSGLFLLSADPSNASYIYWTTTDIIKIRNSTAEYESTPVYRDLSAWYHLVWVWDTTNATAGNRTRLWVNGVEVNNWTVETHPSLNEASGINNNVIHNIGRYTVTSSFYYDGYMTEINFIDGQQLTPSDFGETDSNTGVWKPKAFSGTYGTNGFYLKFADNSGTTSTTLGKDSSGNGNNWTPNNFSVTAGSGNDSLVDSPTSYGTDTGVGGEVRGNYATLNPLFNPTDTTLSNGNLKITTGSTDNGLCLATIGVYSGKWYWEVLLDEVSGDGTFIGITTAGIPILNYLGEFSGSYSYASFNGQKYNSGSGASYGATYATNDIVGVAFDADARTLTFYKNGTSQGTAYSSIPAGTYFPGYSDASTTGTEQATFNFGQRAFAYTAPSGFKALCTQNLPTPTIGATSTTQANDYFNTILYNGNGNTGQTVTGVGFQPNFLWLKNRNQAGGYYHCLFDSVRGAGYRLKSNSTDAEANATAIMSAFTSDGFTFPAGQGNTIENDSAGTYVAWNWKANGAGVSNTAGSITSTVSANTTSGFSIVQWTGSGANGTVGHGLGVAPQFMFMKNKTNSGTGWPSYHAFMDASAPQNYYISMASTDAKTSASNAWNNTAPTSSVFSVGSSSFSNGGTMIAYVFAPVAGYSAFGSYGSNNSLDNAFVYCGFRPRWIMIKSATTGGTNYDWLIFDTVRMSYNYIANTDLRANLATSEGGTARNPKLDILSNGFKVRDSSGEIGSSTTYIFAAFAETPFKYSLAR